MRHTARLAAERADRRDRAGACLRGAVLCARCRRPRRRALCRSRRRSSTGRGACSTTPLGRRTPDTATCRCTRCRSACGRRSSPPKMPRSTTTPASTCAAWRGRRSPTCAMAICGRAAVRSRSSSRATSTSNLMSGRPPAPAQGARGAAGAPARPCSLQGRDPRALPEPRLLRQPGIRAGGGVADVLRQERARAGPRRIGAARGAAAVARGV